MRELEALGQAGGCGIAAQLPTAYRRRSPWPLPGRREPGGTAPDRRSSRRAGVEGGSARRPTNAGPRRPGARSGRIDNPAEVSTVTPMALRAMQKADLDAVTPDVHGLISKQTAHLEGVDVTRVRFDPGARWSNDLKSYAGTESCELPHVGLVLSGRLHVVMDDGSEEEFGPNEVMMLPPGHDAWSVGDEACVFVEFSRGNDYYG
jgi:hypothetical protein